MKYTPNPMQTNDITLSDDLVALTELIAANVHDVWAAGLGALKKDGLMEKLRILKRKPLLGRGLRALLIHKGTKHYSMRKSNPTRFESFVNS